MNDLIEKGFFKNFLVSKYNQEIERKQSFYTKAALYLGIITFFFSILSKLDDTPPSLSLDSTTILLFYLFYILSYIAVGITFFYLIKALWPRRYLYTSVGPEYIDYGNKLGEYYDQYPPDTRTASDIIEKEISNTIYEHYSKSTQTNCENNNIKEGYLIKTIHFITLSLILIILSVISQKVLKVTNPNNIQSVKIINSIKNRKEVIQMANEPKRPAPPKPVSPPKPQQPPPPSRPGPTMIKEGDLGPKPPVKR